MEKIVKKINEVDWDSVTNQMHNHGYAMVPSFLSDAQCQNLIDLYDDTKGYRKKVIMERYRYGLGEYKYFDYPLPDIVQTIRENIYPQLVSVANLWMQMLSIDTLFPESFQQMQFIVYSYFKPATFHSWYNVPFYGPVCRLVFIINILIYTLSIRALSDQLSAC